MPTVFKQITIKNFLSYGKKPTVINLDRNGRTTFMVGKDEDDVAGGTAGNGCGKTAILNALVFGAYDKPLSNISKESLVNNVNRKDMEVTIAFEKDDKPYIVKRLRKGKTGASVHLYEECNDPGPNDIIVVVDGIQYKDITPDSIKATNQKIEKILGVPYELFVRIVAYSANNKSFLELPASSKQYANQRDIIEELFELKVLTERAEALSQWIKDATKDFQMQKDHIDQLKEEHQRHHKLVDSTKKRVDSWKGENEAEVKTIHKKLAKIEGINIDKEHSLHIKLDTFNTELREKTLELKGIERALVEETKKRKANDAELEELRSAKCPYCKQTLHDNEMLILEVEAKISDNIAEVDKLSEQLSGLDEEISTLETEQQETSAKIEVPNIKELIDIRSKQDQYRDRLKHLEEETNPHLATLKELEEIDLEPIDTSRLDDLDQEIIHQKFLLKGITKNDSYIRKKLLNKKIPYLNQRLAKYLGILGLPHSVRFTEGMTVNISRFGRSLDFGNLSNGQQARLNFAISLAFRDMLERVHGTINVFMLDEVLDVGLDAVGIQAAAKLLKNMARDDGLSIFIISHKEELANAFEAKMQVVMEKGFSHIEE